MTTQVHDIGEEFEIKVLSGHVGLPTSIDVGLYHDGEVSGNTTDGDNLGSGASDPNTDITTEPDGTNYGRVTVSLDGATSWNLALDANSDFQMEEINDENFQLDDSSNPSTIDAYFVAITWDSNDDGTTEETLWWTDSLDGAYDVQSIDSFDLQDISLAHSGQNAP